MPVDLSTAYQIGQIVFGGFMVLLVLGVIGLFGLRWFKGR